MCFLTLVLCINVKIPWTEKPGTLQSMGLLESDTTEQLHFHFSLSCIGEGNGNPLQCFYLENPRDGGAWWAAIYEVVQSQAWLKWLSSSSSSSFSISYTRPFRYDLNQIPYDYTVEVRNRFKGLDLLDSACRTMDRGSWHCTGGSDQDHPPRKRNASCLRRSYKYLRKEEKLKAKEKRKDIPIWMQSSKE